MEPGGDGSSAPNPSSTLKCSNYSLILSSGKYGLDFEKLIFENLEANETKLKISAVWQVLTFFVKCRQNGNINIF